MSIVDVKFSNTKLKSLSKSIKQAAQTGGAQLIGKEQVQKFITYLITEQYKNIPSEFNADSHEGNHLFSMNFDMDMLNPFEMNKLNAFATKAEYDLYLKEYSALLANEFMNSSECRFFRTDGNQWDMGRYIISCTKEELEVFKTDEEKVAFLTLYANRTLMALSNCDKVEDINFKYMIVPHLKEGNPHVHIALSSYTFDQKPVYFYRNAHKNGVLRKFCDVKYAMEMEYPNLIPMEIEHRKQQLNETSEEIKDKKTVINSNGKSTSYDKEIIGAIKLLSEKYKGDNYYHADVKADFEKLGLKLLFQKKPKKLLISLDNGAFKSFENLPYEQKRIIEQFDEMEYAQSKTDVDVSKVIKDASQYINQHIYNGNPVDFETLNNQLKSKFGVCLSAKDVERNQKTGIWEYKKWSLHFMSVDIKVSAQKYGIDTSNLKLTRVQVQAMQQEIQTLEQERKAKIQALGYEKKTKNEKESFMRKEGETYEEWVARTSKTNFESALHKLTMDGNKFFGKNHKELMTVLSGNKVTVNQGGELEAVLYYISMGYESVKFTGPQNPAIQARFYKHAFQNGLKIIDYEPPAVIKQEAQQALDKVYYTLLGKNTLMIDKKIEEMKASPDTKHQLIYLQTNFKWEKDIDTRPKLYAYLYGVYNGLTPEAFAHMDTMIETADKATLKAVIADFQQAQSLTDKQLEEILADANIDLNAESRPAEKLAAPKQYNPQSAPSEKPGSPASPPKTDSTETLPETQLEAARTAKGGFKAKPKPVLTPSTEKATPPVGGPAKSDKTVGNEALKKFKRGHKNKT